MFRTSLAVCISLVLAVSLVAAAPVSQSKLSADEIVQKNIAARGGLQAWRGVKTLSLQGKLGAGGNQRATLAVPSANPKMLQAPQRRVEEAQLPFLMELERGRKVRFELQFAGK